ncbi:hypothetical protein [Paraburkholderia sp. A2RI-6]
MRSRPYALLIVQRQNVFSPERLDPMQALPGSLTYPSKMAFKAEGLDA